MRFNWKGNKLETPTIELKNDFTKQFKSFNLSNKFDGDWIEYTCHVDNPRNQPNSENDAIQQEFFNSLSSAHYDWVNLDILSKLMFEFIQTEHPNVELDIDQKDVREFLVKMI